MSPALLLLALVPQSSLFQRPLDGWAGTNVRLSNASSDKGRSLTLHATEGGVNPWSNVAHKKTDAPLANGDVVTFRAWMRSPNQATIGIMFELASPPNTKYLAHMVMPPSTWKEYRFAGKVGRDLPSGQAQLALFMGYGAGTVELADLRLENLGQVDVSKLPQTIDYYGSQPNSSAWRKPALARIEKIRKGDLTVRVVDGNGRPVRNARVAIEQTRHAFKFGTAAPAARLVGTSQDDVRFQGLVERLFNTVTFENDLKWNSIDNQDFTRVDQAIDWLRQRDMDVRGHTLVWGGETRLPRGLWARTDAEVRQALERRVKNTAARFAGKVYLWDVVNEAVTETALWDRIGWPYFADVFKWARAADPKALLAYNDYNITEESEAGPGHRNKAKERLDYLVKAGAPFDVIGIQAHVGVPITPMTRVLQILDEMARYGKRLEITEYDLGVLDDAVNGEHMRDFLTACFSHPQVDAFIMWGFWEGSHWRALQGGAMVRKDWALRPAAKVWEDLTKRQWWTKANGVTASDGAFKMRGFKGNYRVTVNGKDAGTISLLSATNSTTIKIP